MERQLLTPQQVGTHCVVSKHTVYRWIRTGKLPAVRIGQLIRIDPADLDAFLAAGQL